MTRRLLYAIVTGAGPASDVEKLINDAHQRDWDVQLISSPSGLPFLDVDRLEALTGRPVRSEYRKPGEPRSQPADAVVVAPATYNTINKLALGISDTYALGVLAEAVGLGLPVVILPFVNTALASREPFRRSVDQLRVEGVAVLLGPGGFEPHPARTGHRSTHSFPWETALDVAEATLMGDRITAAGEP